MHPPRRIPATLREKCAPRAQGCGPSHGADDEWYVDVQFGSLAGGPVSLALYGIFAPLREPRCHGEYSDRLPVILGINCVSKGARALVDRRIRIQGSIASS